jgi:hypothetical protein
MPNAGDFIRASDTTDLFVRKTATESVTSSTTLQDDDDLVLAVEADSVYLLDALLFYDGGTAGDFKLAFTYPTGATIDYVHTGPPTTASGGTGNTVDNRLIVETDTLGLGAAGAGTTLGVHITGVLVVDSTAGSLQLQWAQFASSGTATRVFAPSYLYLRKVED